MKYFQLKLYLFLIILCVCSIDCITRPGAKKKGQQLNNKTLTWTCPFKDSVKNVNESGKWSKFLNTLYCKFSEYKVQVAKRSYRVNNNEHFEKQDCEIEHLIHGLQSRYVDINNFKIFLNKIVKCNLTKYDSIENIAVTGLQIDELNHVLNLTLRDKLIVQCEGTNVFIKGHYIAARDVIDILNFKNEMRDGNCKNLLSSDKTKFLNIFALSTFFIDVNINSSIINSRKIALISIIAPRWENIGKNKINLKGEDAELPDVGNTFDGKPGKPGCPGGNFFGIGREFVNGRNLEISVNGGNGNRGEEGRKGANGIDGDTVTTSDLDCSENLCKKDAKYRNFFYCKTIVCEISCQAYACDATRLLRGCKYEVFGKPGKKGQNGGKGGKGGKGGYAGNIELVELHNDSQISLLKHAGKDGVDGRGGAGGLGGRKGKDVTVKCSRVHGISWSIESTKSNDERAESGHTGINGGNSIGIENPKLPIVISNLNKAKTINRYKGYLRENLHNRFINYYLNMFLNEIETDIKVRKIYNTLGLIDELQQLEEQFLILNNDINFLPFYQLLLGRISDYAKAPNEIGDLKPYKKVLCYLYTAVLGKIHNIKDNIESNLIIDIYAYLSSVRNDIQKLTDLKNSKYKDKLINKYKDEYKNEIDIKIKEAKELISKEIRPEIDNIDTEIDSQIEMLVNEVIYLKEQAEKKHNELIKKQQYLQSKLGLQGIFSVLKIFGAVVSFLGPVGSVAGSVIEIGSTIAESFVSGNMDGQTKIFELPQSISELQSINNKMTNIINQRITCLNNSLQGISLEIIKHPYILSDMSFKILSIKDRLDKLDKNKPNFKEIQALESALDETLQKKEENSDYKNEKHLAVIKNLKRIVLLSTLLSESYNKYKNNRGKLDTISSAIEQNYENLKKIKAYEQKIYNSMLPMLQNIQNDLQDIMSRLGTKSKVALDVSKWHVQSSLRDMLLLMHQLTRGFGVEDNLARCLEKLSEAMNALINVHEHIQDYQKDQNLANYIAEISSITATDIVIANNAILQNGLRQSVRNLEITVRSNIVLQRYKIAMDAFKQFVFPFAHAYFKDLILPSHLTLRDDRSNTTLENLVYKATVEIEKINSKLEDYKNTVTNRDGCIGIGGFHSGYVSSKPFFVWKNVQYKNMISELLSGNIVTVKADVRNSAPDKDAIKFNVIDFNFKSINETLQSELNNKLKGFQVTLYHLGNSDYRYENKIYEMMTGSQEIWYYFEKKANGEPIYYSLSYKKIMHGNITLSPYASWKIKLDNVTDVIFFKDLEKYKGSVDLTLEGYGYFLNKRSRNCRDLMVDKYYKAIGIYPVNSNVQSYALRNPYPLQNNVFKNFQIFKGFF